MFRRSRFSVRPNVGAVGRTAAGTPQETPAASQETSQTQKEPNESNNASLASSSDVTPSENAPSTGWVGESTQATRVAVALSFTLSSQTNSSNICLATAMTRTGTAPAPLHQSRDGSASPSSPRWLLDGLRPSPGRQNPPSEQSPRLQATACVGQT